MLLCCVCCKTFYFCNISFGLELNSIMFHIVCLPDRVYSLRVKKKSSKYSAGEKKDTGWQQFSKDPANDVQQQMTF